MSQDDNKTALLWRSFKTQIRDLSPKDSLLYSLQKYPADYFQMYKSESRFTKWAAIEQSDLQVIPQSLEELILSSGLYAVFIFIGNGENAGVFFRNIFTGWLPGSGYQLDDRLHFELLGEKYSQGDPQSQEEVWIPIKQIQNHL